MIQAPFLSSQQTQVTVNNEHRGWRPPTWQRRLRLAQQRRRRGQTAGKRLCGAPTVGGAGAWMDLKDDQHQDHKNKPSFNLLSIALWDMKFSKGSYRERGIILGLWVFLM